MLRPKTKYTTAEVVAIFQADTAGDSTEIKGMHNHAVRRKPQSDQ